MKNIFKFIICLSAAFAIAGLGNNVLAVSDSAVITAQVTGECNNNGICESLLGETSIGCPADCGCNNNNVCEPERGETEANCSDCQEGGGGGGGEDVPDFSVYIKNIEAYPSYNSAEILWKTTKPAVCSFYWGKTPEYKEEIISETDFKTDHSVNLSSLLSGTYYHFKIFCQDSLKLKDNSQDKYFKTLQILSNVKNFTALGGDEKIILTWENPDEQNFLQVRLLRNASFFPLNINDGAIVYEGSDVFYLDSNLTNGKKYYYTIFAEYPDKQYSSGAAAYAVPQGKIIVTPVEPVPTEPTEPTGEPGEEEAKKVKFSDFDFYSEGKNLPVKNEKTVEIKNKKNLIISIDSEKLPKGAKTLMADLIFNDNVYSYLFESNKEKTIYNVLIVSPDESGTYPLKFIIFNEKNQKIQEASGELKVSKKKEIIQQCVSFISMIAAWQIFLWLILILLLVILWLMIKNRKNKKNNLK